MSRILILQNKVNLECGFILFLADLLLAFEFLKLFSTALGSLR